MTTRKIALTTLAAVTSLALTLTMSHAADASPRGASQAHRSAPSRVQTASYIVQAQSLAAARTSVQKVGGTITHELGIIHAVAAQLTVAQADALRANSALTLSADVSTKVAGYAGQPYVVRQTEANRLHASGITGRGITIAFLDTGLWPNTPLAKDTAAIGTVVQTSRRIRPATPVVVIGKAYVVGVDVTVW